MDADRRPAGAMMVLAEGNQRPSVIAESRIPSPRNDHGDAAPRQVDWARIYAECHGRMLGIAAYRLARLPGGPDPADVVHDVFADVIGQPPRHVVDWATFLLEATVRRLQGLGDQGADTADDVVETTVEDAAAIAVRRVQAAHTRDRLTRVMDYMTERQREIARLRLFEGRSVGQIATAMGTSSSNISQIVTRCLTKLQPTLAQFDTIDENDVTDLAPPRRVR